MVAIIKTSHLMMKFTFWSQNKVKLYTGKIPYNQVTQKVQNRHKLCLKSKLANISSSIGTGNCILSTQRNSWLALRGMLYKNSRVLNILIT